MVPVLGIGRCGGDGSVARQGLAGTEARVWLGSLAQVSSPIFARHNSTDVLSCQIRVGDGPCMPERVRSECRRGKGIHCRRTIRLHETGKCAILSTPQSAPGGLPDPAEMLWIWRSTASRCGLLIIPRGTRRPQSLRRSSHRLRGHPRRVPAPDQSRRPAGPLPVGPLLAAHTPAARWHSWPVAVAR